jgi:molybdopterin-dependent oxidoreductase alpha subunit
LQKAVKRGVPIVTFNPLHERGLVEFVNPQSPAEMLVKPPTRITSQYHQPKIGGDTAAMMGIAKALFDLDKTSRNGPVLDRNFIREHTHGFEEFEASVRATEWDHIALLRGSIGRPGAGICPVRGHSNVQGQRTVGITEKPEQVPAEKLKQLFGIKTPQKKGVNTVEACEKIIDGAVRAMILLGGTLVRAVPEHRLVDPAWRKLRLTAQILTKLNRTALVHGEISYILPCLGRIEIDQQASGPQAVSMEDSTGCMHGSRGQAKPAGPHLLSEARIVAELAKATVPTGSTIPWDDWVADYSKVRDAIAQTYPEIFHDFNARLWEPGGFHRPIGARKREWKTKTGKANFITPTSLSTDIDIPPDQRDVVQLMTLRSNGQFNTTVYNYDDRFRGVYGSRHVVLMHQNDIDRFNLKEGQMVALTTVVDDGVERSVTGLQIVAYDIPEGCIAGYYPECNPLIPLWHHAEKAKVPAAKSIPVRVHREA